MPTIDELCDDLRAEHETLDELVSTLEEDGWSKPAPGKGWDVGDAISHRNYLDEQATLAIDDPSAFDEHKAWPIALAASGGQPDVETGRELRRDDGSAVLLERWRSSRNRLITRVLQRMENPGDSAPGERLRNGQPLLRGAEAR